MSGARAIRYDALPCQRLYSRAAYHLRRCFLQTAAHSSPLWSLYSLGATY
jgi:hypothetical protein